jgi:hypothetical protein
MTDESEVTAKMVFRVYEDRPEPEAPSEEECRDWLLDEAQEICECMVARGLSDVEASAMVGMALVHATGEWIVRTGEEKR